MTAASSNPHDSKVLSVILCNGCLIIASSLALFVRLFVRIKYMTGIQADDIFCILGWLFSSGECLICILMTGYGYGKHIDTIHSEKELAMFMKLDFVTELMYLYALCAIKTSFCLFYSKIFPEPRFRIVVWCLLGIVLAQTVEETFVVILQCWPIRKAWDPSPEGKQHGKCLSYRGLLAFFYISFAARLLTDIALFMLPIPQLIKLKMAFAKRAGLVFMFGLGLVVVVASIVRSTYLNKFFKDRTYNLVESLNWSSIELELSIFISCFPSFKALVSFRYPGLRRKMGFTTERSYGASYELYSPGPDGDNSRGLSHSAKSNQTDTVSHTHIEVERSRSGSEEPTTCPGIQVTTNVCVS